MCWEIRRRYREGPSRSPGSGLQSLSGRKIKELSRQLSQVTRLSALRWGYLSAKGLPFLPRLLLLMLFLWFGGTDPAPLPLCCFQTYNSQGESNEDYEIPPITPPNLPEPSLLHLGDHEAGYHSLCHGLAPNGLLPAYSYQAMDLPAIMVSNMLAQDGHLLSGQLPTVSLSPP